eukprot:Skav222032  [mRNA]  locus=scaffold1020:5823:6905:- [translate_table: standard]
MDLPAGAPSPLRDLPRSEAGEATEKAEDRPAEIEPDENRALIDAQAVVEADDLPQDQLQDEAPPKEHQVFYESEGSKFCGCRFGQKQRPCRFREKCENGKDCQWCHLCCRNLHKKSREQMRRREMRMVLRQEQVIRRPEKHSIIKSASFSMYCLQQPRIQVIRTGLHAALQEYDQRLLGELQFTADRCGLQRCTEWLKKCWQLRKQAELDRFRKDLFEQQEICLSKEEKRLCNVMFCMRFCSLAWHMPRSGWTFAEKLRCLYSAAWLVSKNTFDDFVMAEFWAACGHCAEQADVGGAPREVLRAMTAFLKQPLEEQTLLCYQFHAWQQAYSAAWLSGANDLAETYAAKYAELYGLGFFEW